MAQISARDYNTPQSEDRIKKHITHEIMHRVYWSQTSDINEMKVKTTWLVPTMVT